VRCGGGRRDGRAYADQWIAQFRGRGPGKVYRGGAPDRVRFTALKSLHVKTVINLQGGDPKRTPFWRSFPPAASHLIERFEPGETKAAIDTRTGWRGRREWTTSTSRLELARQGHGERSAPGRPACWP